MPSVWTRLTSTVVAGVGLISSTVDLLPDEEGTRMGQVPRRTTLTFSQLYELCGVIRWTIGINGRSRAKGPGTLEGWVSRTLGQWIP